MSTEIETTLISQALTKAYHLRQPSKGCVFHSDRGSQYTSQPYRNLLDSYDMRASQGDVGACWDNAVVERFFGRLYQSNLKMQVLKSENCQSVESSILSLFLAT